MEDLGGRQLGPYRVVQALGAGGMATVYKAYQPGMDRYVALKVLPRELAADPTFVGRFQQEARLVAALQHPHILPAFDYGAEAGYTYLVMPFIGGGTLAEELQGGALPLPRIATILRQLASALDYAHDKGLVHRDIKPSNVLLDEGGNCLLADFGIAKLYAATAQFTRAGGILGTPAYMSPEQGLGQPLDRRSDIYSLGILLYEMATGRVPFEAETPIATVFKHINDPLPPPRRLNARLPRSVEQVIQTALAKAPDDRYQTAGAMALDLEAAAGQPDLDATVVDAPPLPPPVPGAGDRSRGRLPLWAWAAGALLLFVICALGTAGALFAARSGGLLPAQERATAALEVAISPAITPSAARQVATATPTLLPTAEATATLPVTETAVPTPQPSGTPTAETGRQELPGSGTIQLTFDELPSFTPIFSDDQRQMLLVVESGGYWRLARVDPAAGGAVEILTSNDADYFNPRFAADGRRALVSTDPNGEHDLYYFDMQTRELVEQLTSAPGDDVYPQWLGDRSGFVFMSYRDGNAEVYLQRLDGTPAERLTAHEAFDGFADIAPDGRTLAFQSNRDGNHEIYVMDMAGRAVTRLTFDDARDAVPVFSRDGAWIVFESSRSGGYDLWAMRPDGSGLFNVTSTPGNDQVPVFSPDGRWLAFQSDRDGDMDIYRLPWPMAD